MLTALVLMHCCTPVCSPWSSPDAVATRDRRRRRRNIRHPVPSQSRICRTPFAAHRWTSPGGRWRRLHHWNRRRRRRRCRTGLLQRAAIPAEEEGLVPRPPLPPAACTSLGGVEGPHPDPARPAAPHQVVMVAVVVAAATVAGAVVAAPAPTRPPPGRLVAPRQATLAAVALAEAEGHLHKRQQCPHLHLHPYPLAPHRRGALAHPDPDPQLLSRMSTHTDASGTVRVRFRLPSFAQQKRSRLRNLNRMLHAGTIYFCTMIGPVTPPVDQIRATTAGFSDVLHCTGCCHH